MYLSSPIIMAILGRYPRLARPCIVVGFIITVAMLIAASFAESIQVLIFTQGKLRHVESTSKISQQKM